MKDKVVIITGASQGLGQELSIQVSELGAKVALVARTEKLLKELREKIITSGGVAESYVCDVTNLDQVNQTVSKIVEKFGTIDVLINNAGVWTSDELEVKNPDLIKEAFMVNSVGPVYFCKAVAPIFEKNNSGHFIFINSIAGLEMPESHDCGVYAASKFALTGFTKALKYKYNKTPIKISSVHPGPFTSNLAKNSGDDWGTDDSWMMNTSEVANAVIYTLTAPDKMQIGQIELKYTNWNK